MAVNTDVFKSILAELGEVTLVAVSKTKPVEDILELYNLGQRDFGENYVQELLSKQPQLPGDIRWHYIGHLQSNKVKYIIPFVHLIHGVDSFKLLKEIDKQAQKLDRKVNCLLQVHIAQEETKFGLDEKELGELAGRLGELPHVKVVGLMGMASFTDDVNKIKTEFHSLQTLFKKTKASHPEFNTLSMGMSADYKIALTEGTTIVRIGSLLFGTR